VRPLPQSVTTDQPIYIVASRRGKLRAEALALRDWLIEEARTGFVTGFGCRAHGVSSGRRTRRLVWMQAAP
jgi:hypothetical protein